MGTVDELFNERYRLNDDYHNRKEEAIWLASTIYLGFVVSSVLWLLGDSAKWLPLKPYVLAFAVLLLVFALTFLTHQNWNRARSVRITEQMDDLVERLASGGLSPSDLQHALGYPKKDTRFADRWCVFWSRGRIGNTVALVVFLFGGAELVLVAYYDRPPKPALPVALVIVAIALLLATILLGRRRRTGSTAPRSRSG